MITTKILTPGLNVPYPLRIGDFDGAGNYWASSVNQGGLTYWTEVNLLPNTTNYGKQVASGSAVLPITLGVYDWVYLPEGGQSMWTVATGLTVLGFQLYRFDLSSKTWVASTNYGSLLGLTINSGFGALYPGEYGYFYGSENAGGAIWRFPLPGNNGDKAVLVSQGPISSQNDGARCWAQDV
ncbi:hypothetical protein diail_218 [Diaporthe ilicicola]|nr:hypothetical protein diail_218 [Diaporthe ilicicola]